MCILTDTATSVLGRKLWNSPETAFAFTAASGPASAMATFRVVRIHPPVLTTSATRRGIRLKAKEIASCASDLSRGAGGLVDQAASTSSSARCLSAVSSNDLCIWLVRLVYRLP